MGTSKNTLLTMKTLKYIVDSWTFNTKLPDASWELSLQRHLFDVFDVFDAFDSKNVENFEKRRKIKKFAEKRRAIVLLFPCKL